MAIDQQDQQPDQAVNVQAQDPPAEGVEVQAQDPPAEGVEVQAQDPPPAEGVQAIIDGTAEVPNDVAGQAPNGNQAPNDGLAQDGFQGPDGFDPRDINPESITRVATAVVAAYKHLLVEDEDEEEPLSIAAQAALDVKADEDKNRIIATMKEFPKLRTWWCNDNLPIYSILNAFLHIAVLHQIADFIIDVHEKLFKMEVVGFFYRTWYTIFFRFPYDAYRWLVSLCFCAINHFINTRFNDYVGLWLRKTCKNHKKKFRRSCSFFAKDIKVFIALHPVLQESFVEIIEDLIHHIVYRICKWFHDETPCERIVLALADHEKWEMEQKIIAQEKARIDAANAQENARIDAANAQPAES